MAFIVQRARSRAQHRAGRPDEGSSGGFRPAPSFASPLPAMNRAMRRGLAHRRPIAAALIPGVLLAVLALNLAASHSRSGAPLPLTAGQAQSSIATAGTAGGMAALAAPGFPGGIGPAADVTAGQVAARVPAVLAADLWQAANAVYQSNIAGVVLGVPSPQTVATAMGVSKPAGPTLDELLTAQARVASAQLVLLSLQQHATDDQISAARGAVAQAQSQLAASQNAVAQSADLARQSQLQLAPAVATVVPTATPVPAPTASPEQLSAAQAEVDRARAALAKAQHPFTDAQISAAQEQLASSQAALNAALARASAAAAATRAATAAPPAIAAATAPPAAAKPAATPAPTVSPPQDPSAAIRGPIPGVANGAPAPAGPGGVSDSGPVFDRGQSDPPVQAAPAAGPLDGPAVPAAAAAGPLDGSGAQAAPAGQAEPPSGAAASAGAPIAAGDPAPAPVTAAAVTLVAATTAPAAVTASAPAAVPAAASATPVAGASGERAATATATDDIPTLREWLSISQQTVALYTAPPDPKTVQAATDALAAAEQRLAELQGTAAQDSAGGSSNSAANASAAAATTAPTVAPTPVPTATPTAATASPLPVDLAQAAYQQAVTQLQWMSVQADPATVKAAEDDYNTAKLALADLLAKADQSVAGQLDPNPQTALAKVGFVGSGLPQHDAVAFAWPAIGPITSYFGPSHPLGIDIGQGLGLPVRATASGVVSFSGGDPCCSYGYYIDIQHAGGYMSRYGHLLTQSFLKQGDKVAQGQIIGVSGSTGFSTGPHVHFELRYNGVPLDGLRLLSGALPAPLGH